MRKIAFILHNERVYSIVGESIEHILTLFKMGVYDSEHPSSNFRFLRTAKLYEETFILCEPREKYDYE